MFTPIYHHVGQKKHYNDTLDASLKAFNINPDLWEKLALHRPTWHNLVQNGVKLLEDIYGLARCD